ncbi:MAG: ABC transporter ATP-binding protein [Gammaproteobacteria bacterium]|jgi:ABC-2 type transport system ATP-binding protein|nr:ABC transporter [Chromatiales bacterium]MCP4926753.1 ABC transporter ATP-binding protein [Gammaproteobacteria bacterium]
MNALSIRNLVKVYGNGVRALKGVDLDVSEGDFFALLGPNGAGKTTAIGIITSLVTKTSGKVHVFGHDIDTELNAAKACIGIVPQEINLNSFDRVMNIVINQAGFYGLSLRRARPRAQQVLEQLRLWDRRDEVARNLSGGMKRRLMIARALVHSPRLLILDEPTAGVDIEIRRTMWTFLRELNDSGTTIILTTHYLEEAENLCRHVAIIDDGEVIQHHPMDDFLRTLKQQNFIINTRDKVDVIPTLDGCLIHQLKDFELEIAVQRNHDLNDVFAALSAAGIKIISMRNKTNRLEELFFDLTDRSDPGISAESSVQSGTEV